MSFTTKSRIKMQSGSGFKPIKKPEIPVIYKPKSKIELLNIEQAGHLNNIINGGLMRKVTPAHIEAQFLKEGYIRKAVGGLMITDAGHHAFMLWQKGGKK